MGYHVDDSCWSARVSRRQLAQRPNGGSSLWELGGLPDGAARELERWLDGLSDLTLDQWCEIGRACTGDESAWAARAASAAALELVIDCQQLAVTTWYVRDLVDTAAYVARHEAEGAGRKVRRQLADAVAAAETAALAIAAAEWLPDEDAARLRAPFGLPNGPNALRLV